MRTIKNMDGRTRALGARYKKAITDNIRLLMKRRYLTGDELGARMGMTRQNISRILNQSDGMLLSTICAFTYALKRDMILVPLLDGSCSFGVESWKFTKKPSDAENFIKGRINDHIWAYMIYHGISMQGLSLSIGNTGSAVNQHFWQDRMTLHAIAKFSIALGFEFIIVPDYTKE